MHRLTVFKHDIICDVDDVVYRSDSAGSETGSQPERRGSDLYVFDCFCAVSGAKRRIVDSDGKIIGDVIFSVALRAYGLGIFEFFVQSCGAFACYRGERKAIGTIEGKLKIDDCVVKHTYVFYVVTGLAVFFKNEYAVLYSIREIVFVETQFAERTEHTFGKHTAELSGFYCLSAGQKCAVLAYRDKVACLYVLSTGDDLKRLSFADIELAYDEVVGIRVFFR